MRKWLLLNSPNYRVRLAAVVEAAGDLVVCHDGWWPARGLAPETPDVVCCDHNTGRSSVLVGGFYRGYGLPVVWVTRPDRGKKSYDSLARTLGFFVIDDPGKIANLFRPDCPYLRTRPPGRDLTPEAVAAFLADFAHAGKGV